MSNPEGREEDSQRPTCHVTVGASMMCEYVVERRERKRSGWFEYSKSREAELETSGWRGTACCEYPALLPEAMKYHGLRLPQRAMSGPVAME